MCQRLSGLHPPGFLGGMLWQLNLTLGHRRDTGSPLPAAFANQRVLIYHVGAHGVARPNCPKVAKNGYSPFGITERRLRFRF